MNRPLAVLAVLTLALAACEPEPVNATPEGAVLALSEHLERYQQGRLDHAEAAFELLSEDTQAALGERAERYAAASGKRITPAHAIAPESFHLRFAPKKLSSRIEGPYAVVLAEGLVSGARAEIPCVYEEGGWRVHILIPPLAPLKMSPRDGNVSDR